MSSKDDDTLPLPGPSQEFSVNVTVDEDFIPTSQPQGASGSNFSKSGEVVRGSDRVSDSSVDDTLPPEVLINQSVLDKDKSSDFIPDTETKTGKRIHVKEELSCKKKLGVFEEGVGWEGEVPGSPAPREGHPSGRGEESVTEIIVNDSAETVVLEGTPVRLKTSPEEGSVGKLEISCSSQSDVEKCEETQIFDNSSVLLLDHPGFEGGAENPESGSGSTSNKLYLQKTADDSHEENPEEKTNGFEPKENLRSGALQSSKNSEASGKIGDLLRKKVFHEEEVQPKAEANSASVATRKVDFKLTVSCLVTFNTRTNKILQKIILNVNETPQPKPKTVYLEPASDNASDKSKRQSTSSSGSVYSDRTGPFALPKRVSDISDQTDSSEEEFGFLPKKERRALERVPWSNEYLLPLKMDDLILVAIEKQDLVSRPNVVSPGKFKPRHRVNHLKEILENSTCSEETPPRDSVAEQSEPGKRGTPELGESREGEEGSEEPPPAEERAEKREVEGTAEAKEGAEPTEERSLGRLGDGVPVFARWTDKRYYPGVLSGGPKNDRWEVEFDDGTWKTVREDFLMPAEWVKAGSLVFVLTEEKYESGQVVDVRRGEEAEYVVELDTEKKEVSVRLSDLCLTEVMAGIVREKYKPLRGTPRGKADIDFDNVVSGKRQREQRTPLRPTNVPAGSSGSKKSTAKSRKDEGSLQSIRETAEEGRSRRKARGLTSENGHLVEDKVISGDSPSAGETPLRRNPKEPRKKAKPRSLSYEAEGKKRSWLAPDGTPIPGPSGVKNKRQNTKTKAEGKESPGTSKAPPSTGKSKRKRKLDESTEGTVQKKSMKEEGSRVKTRTRKG